MQKTYSIAEARNQFTTLVRNVEQNKKSVQVTRRGMPVAVILSQNEYNRLLAQTAQRDFWQAYLKWREVWEVDAWEETTDPFKDIRDSSPGREVNLWD